MSTRTVNSTGLGLAPPQPEMDTSLVRYPPQSYAAATICACNASTESCRRSLTEPGARHRCLYHFYRLFRPVPFHQLNVSQIRWNFWSGLACLCIFTYSFFQPIPHAPASAETARTFPRPSFLYKWAHQCGATSGMVQHRDQWIDEVHATTCHSCLPTSENPLSQLRLWLDRYRKRLLEKTRRDIVPAEIGSLI